jgi:FkbM family methyltransferase
MNYEELKKIKPKVIFDIGACDFGDSKNYKGLFPDAKVYGVEADPTNYELHSRSAEELGIKTFNFAMSDREGTITFYPSLREIDKDIDWRYAGSIMKPLLKPDTNEALNHKVTYDIDGIEIPTKRFDNFCKEINVDEVDFLHIDVEGAEYKVVQSFGDIRPKLIYAETYHYELKSYDNEMNLEEFNNLMFSMGYEILERMTYDTLYKYKN